MGIIPQGNEIGLQAVGTVISYVTGVPFLGSVLSGVFGNSERPRYNPRYWSSAPSPVPVTNQAEQRAINAQLREEFMNGGTLKVVHKEKGQYVLRTHLRPDTNAQQRATLHAARKTRQAQLAVEQAARDAKKQVAKAAKEAKRNKPPRWAGPAT